MDKQVLKMKKAPLEADRKKADELYNLLIKGADKGQKAGARTPSMGKRSASMIEAQKRYRQRKQAEARAQKEQAKQAKQAERRRTRQQKLINYGRRLERAMPGRGLKSAYAQEQRASGVAGDELLKYNSIKFLTPLVNVSGTISTDQQGGKLNLLMPQILGSGKSSAKNLISPSNMTLDDRNINGLNL